MKEVILDTETTGLSVKEGHRIVEIGCIELENFIPTNNNFHCYLNPGRKVSEKALETHGYTDEFLSDKKKFKEIADDFLLYIKDKKLIIHNAKFDVGFLNSQLKEIKLKEINFNSVIDSLEVARNKFPGVSNSLDSLCKRYNIDLSRRTKHNALLDCELLREVYINLIGVKEPKFAFESNNKKNTYIKKHNNVRSYSKKIIKIDQKEIINHQEFLKKELKKNYY